MEQHTAVWIGAAGELTPLVSTYAPQEPCRYAVSTFKNHIRGGDVHVPRDTQTTCSDSQRVAWRSLTQEQRSTCAQKSPITFLPLDHEGLERGDRLQSPRPHVEPRSHPLVFLFADV